MAANLITVRSTIPTRPDGGNVVALYETHEDHPNGEAFVAGPKPVEVARTGMVHRLISDGTLEEISGDDKDDEHEEAATRSTRRPRASVTPSTQDGDDDKPPEA